MLSAANLVKRFGGILAVHDVSISIEPGEIVGLVGPNGAGKTTLFDLISGFRRPTAGSLHLGGHRIEGLSPEARVGLGIRRTFQEVRVFGELTVLENVCCAIAPTSMRSWFGNHDDSTRAHAAETLRQIQLEDRQQDLAADLSYGQTKLVSLGCALAAEPTLLLLDEPAAGVAPAMAAVIQKLVEDAAHEGAAVLIIEHDFEFLAGLTQRIVFMDEGAVVFEGTASEMRESRGLLQRLVGSR